MPKSEKKEKIENNRTEGERGTTTKKKTGEGRNKGRGRQGILEPMEENGMGGKGIKEEGMKGNRPQMCT